MLRAQRAQTLSHMFLGYSQWIQTTWHSSKGSRTCSTLWPWSTFARLLSLLMHVWPLSFFRERCRWGRFLPLDPCGCSEETLWWTIQGRSCPTLVFIGGINCANRKLLSQVCTAAFIQSVFQVQHILLIKEILFMYLLMVVPCLHCCAWAFSSCGERGSSPVAVHRLSLCWLLLLQ